jgi:hypothetical protein
MENSKRQEDKKKDGHPVEFIFNGKQKGLMISLVIRLLIVAAV